MPLSDTSEPDTGRALDTVSRDLRAPRAAGVAGLAFAVLFIVSLLLLRSQPAAASGGGGPSGAGLIRAAKGRLCLIARPERIG